MITIGIIGGGFVGKAMKLFENEQVLAKIYDLDPSRCSEGVNSLADLKDCQLFFICVNTPMIQETGQCYTKIVEDCIAQVRETCQPGKSGNIIVRSTVSVGFCKEQGVMFMPEFLTEKNWREDILKCKEWYVGIDNVELDTVNLLKRLFDASFPHANVHFLKTKECELIKYFRNAFLATKIGFCNEFACFCEATGVDYSTVQKHATMDSRIGASHTNVPGCDGQKGYGGHCLPKDVASLLYQMNGSDVVAPILESVYKRNVEVDRPAKDWTQDVGRAVI
jgi:UDPglucose 6-dehydrogenase